MGRQDVTMRGAQSGVITHGSQITTANTGYLAYFRTDLGRLQTLGDLTTVSGTHYLTDFTGGSGGTISSPKILTGYRFTGDVICDQPYITLRGCLMDNPTGSYLSGVHSPGYRLDYCTVSPATAGDQCVQYESWYAYRCQLRGCSDGAKVNGGVVQNVVEECHIRVKMQDAADHNDTLQNVAGQGNISIRRSNLSVNPEGGVLGGGLSGGPNACFQSAGAGDPGSFGPGAHVYAEVIDCLLDGTNSAYTLRFYDGGDNADVTYKATGNRFVRSSSGPLDRGSQNTTPTGQITWSGNVWDDDGSSIALV